MRRAGGPHIVGADDPVEITRTEHQVGARRGGNEEQPLLATEHEREEGNERSVSG